MNYFLLTAGIIFVFAAVIMFILDNRKEMNEVKNLELINVQTEQLIEELNEISTIVVDEMDKKYNSMLDVYKEFEVLAAGKQKAQGGNAGGVAGDSENRQQKVLSLYKEGVPRNRIASYLNMGVGEVELILKLAGKGGNKNEKIT